MRRGSRFEARREADGRRGRRPSDLHGDHDTAGTADTARPAALTADAPARAGTGFASFADRHGAGVVECIDLTVDAARLAEGLWFVVADFEGPAHGGRARAWRFAHHGRTEADLPASATPSGGESDWQGPAPDAWRSSLSRDEYQSAVAAVRHAVHEGDVYQANICRVLSAPLPADGREPDARALARVLAAGNPAPYAGAIHVPATSGVDPVWVVTASPELFLRLEGGVLSSGPIKGTAPTAAGLRDKDRTENVMITDLVRNDLQRVSAPGSVEVTDLLAVEAHPGLVHLVSRVQGRLTAEEGAPGGLWGRVLDATFPPASVSGAPKSSALRIIRELERGPRGPYCGAVGWIDGDTGEAELAVGIRTFWWTDDELRFGTGAGITWGSDPAEEWAETELKAARLVALASGGPAAD
ncbi:anthranilate synthase component I family protein [Oerskovia turbata]|uniref:Anthranilate synthase component I family protein n=1 Tax=Oerskovia turbata TaxID=1713 RepID=A0A4Q1KXI0_9CELL|nr:chorismate-binding protein [Oerskovia turbata]RXR24745.1 anthranilate synthase component I family protein [Oerskovia turbata]RXR35051.1 anthranilate synthase component I family protein [Oerskovia turbata]TGJ97118.1 chloride transporter [Actinotalea fermentans ATCC 43279 = JCM 9966 = DSM 3133]